MKRGSERRAGWMRLFPPFAWLVNYQRGWLRSDTVAGITLAAYAIPVSLAYATLAGLPPQIGVYGYLLGGLGYALLGASRQLAIGPTSAISLMIAGTVAPLAAGDPLRYAQIASLVACAVAVLCLISWLFRLSILVRLVSDSILAGFKAGAGLTIIMSQLPSLFGVAGGGHNFFDRAIRLAGQLGDTHLLVLAVGLIAIGLLLLGERFLPGRPVGITVVALSVLAATLLGLPAMGVPVTGKIPEGLPGLALPTFGLVEPEELFPIAAGCLLLAYIEGVSAARSFAAKHGYALDVRQEFLGLGAANLAVAFGQGYPVAGGLSQSAVNDNSGARTPLALVICSVTLALCLLFFTGLLTNLPKAVLAAIVFAAVYRLVDIAVLSRMWKVSRIDFFAAAIALISVLLLGILQGVLLAAVASIVLLLLRASQPNVAFLGRLPGTGRYSDRARHQGVEPLVGIVAFRPEASLLYINAETIMAAVLSALRRTASIRLVVCDLSASPIIDLAGARMLHDLFDELASRGIMFAIVGAHAQLRDLLRAEGLAEKTDSAQWLRSLDSVLGDDKSMNVVPFLAPQEAHPDGLASRNDTTTIDLDQRTATDESYPFNKRLRIDREKHMSKDGTPAQKRIDQFFSGPGGRADDWRDLVEAAKAWARGGDRAQYDAVLGDLSVTEEYHGYPGLHLMAALKEAAQSADAATSLALATRITQALTTKSFRQHAGDWNLHDEGNGDVPDLLPPTFGGKEAHRPYFETLIVTGVASSSWPALAAEWRKLRRPIDAFIYEPVIVGSLEDAFCAAILNADLGAVVINEGFALRSRHDAPILRTFTDAIGPHEEADVSALRLAHILKRVRPELDIYLMSNRDVEEMAGNPEANVARRIFYSVEEILELHLSILEGVQDRYDTPFFDNLKKYAQRPVGTFHALPIARGKSIFKSDWIRDMGEFYGPNLFLAESSATTGGLDSLLEPTGNIKKAQEKAARAFGADHVFFVTNGTSTSNKMAVQALLAPGDIAIVDRNCHKSHHYGMVLAGAQPLYVEAFPMTEYSMYGAVPLATIKQALLNAKADGRLDRVKMVDLTNCTFDGHIYNTRRVMEECLAIKPDLIFLWDEAWFGFARFSPFLRPRTAMGAANDIEAWMHDPKSVATYEKQQAELGKNPSDEILLKTRLIPDPRQVRLRVYQTNSTHKSMSAIRQGSMLLVKDVDFHTVEAQFHEAVFTHASTSPNQQLIASLDVARRQMELEGYGLVNNAMEIALAIRQAVNSNPLLSKYFRILDASAMVPAAYRQTGFIDYLAPGTNWATALKSLQEDEFCLDPTRMTLVCGTAGFDGTQFKGILANQYGIQVNKTSRNSVLFQSNINNTRSDVAHLIRVLAEIAGEVDRGLVQGGANAKKTFEMRVKSLMHDVPDLPNFSYFHPSFRGDAGTKTNEGNIRGGFYAAYDAAGCEYIRLADAEIDRRLKSGPDLVSANFVIPYPPGFPIMVPGQVITRETIEFMRKLDVKEIHGYDAREGLKLVRADALARIARPEPAAAPKLQAAS